MSVTVLLLLPALCWRTEGFNLEPRHSEVIMDPTGDSNSYFGYALGFWNQETEQGHFTWLFVGAPRGYVKDMKGERVRRPGAVYKCQVGVHNVSTCTVVPVLGTDDNTEQDLVWRRKIKNIPARAWIGATIAVENKPNGGIVVCGPRMKRWMNVLLRYIPGTCYYWENDAEVTVLPLIESVYPNKESGFETGFAQVGLSADFLQDTNKTQLLLGAPGINYFQGAMSIYEKDYVKPSRKGLPSLHMPLATHVSYDSYMGYSVAIGRFHKDGSVSYVAGAPRAEGSDFFTGAVYVVQQPHEKKWREVSTLKGFQMGEYFGATLAVLDLDSDGLDDLLVVGAPLHSPLSTNEVTSAGDLGMVYIYLNKGEAQLELLEEKLIGSSVPGARFGSSLAVVGDVNKDGYTDLMVGAPYEGSGAVYLYHGQDRGFRGRYCQRIAASDIDFHLKGFGISISSGMDIDGNSFNDIAVGGHETSRAVIIKSYPVIDFHATLEPSVKRLDINATKFEVDACIKYNSKADPLINQKIGAEMTLRVDTTLRRAVFQNQNDATEKQVLTRQITLNRDVTFCWKVNVTLQGNLFQVTQPVEVSLDYKVLDDPAVDRLKEFCKMCPVIDPLKPSSVHAKIPFAHGCKSKIVCKADLKVEVNSSSNGEHVVLSENTRLNLSVTISNVGEPAYLSKLSVTIPGRNMLLKVPRICYQHAAGESKAHMENFICNLANPLGNQVKKVSVMFEVDLSGIDLYTTHLTFNFTAWSASEELTPQDNTFIVTVPIALISQVVIKGKTNQRNVMLISEDLNVSNIIPVFHKYEVVNYGPSPVGEFVVEFQVPVGLIQERDSENNIFLTFPDPQLTLDGHIFRCEVERGMLNDSLTSSLMDTHWPEATLELEVVPHRKMSVEDSQQKRRRRSLENWLTNTTDLQKIHVRRALQLNCSEMGTSKVLCVPITCLAGPLTTHSRAEVNLQLYFYKSVLESLFDTVVDAVQFQTFGMVDIVEREKYTVPLDHRHKVSSVETMFMGEVTGDAVAPWILPLAIALGLLLLLLLVKGLSNVGFFKRGHREKLELMKEKVAAEEEFKIKFNSLNAPLDLSNNQWLM